MINSTWSATATRRSSRAFTLIELLVVISIIMLLAAIALPVLAKAARQARAAICVSNLKQMGVTFRSYSTNNDGYTPASAGCRPFMPDWLMPYAFYSEPNKAFEGAPKGTLFPYYNDPGLVLCPTDKEGNGKYSYSSPNNIGYRIMDNVTNPSDALLIIEEDPQYYLVPNREAGFACADRPALRHSTRAAHASFAGNVQLTAFPPGTTAYDFMIDPWGVSCGYRDWQ